MLKETSRTFYIPITLLGSTLRRTVGSAYLCMRAIDEIEDHETLDSVIKEHLLRSTSVLLTEEFDDVKYHELIDPYKESLPEVTVRLDRKSTRLNSSHVAISYAVFCLKKKFFRNYKKTCIPVDFLSV